ncbi:quinone oxidoreductase family protein [Saccharothrix syringae]|uniref:quinone oxidoreductase family protein n=1 Tax=Saccharothrix syringae TaxID=103733 RepID=UPI000AA2D07C|nr:NADP-dependent oxidoreductase [Saccharothrix syringae]
MVRAVGITERGGPEVLAVVDRDVREPGEGEVRIAVRAAAVNPTDIGLREVGADLPPPWVPGMDAAGVVEAVGPGARRLRVGDEVMAAVSPRRPEGGAQAELLVVPESSAVPIPVGASLAEAATLPMNGLTAKLGLSLLGLRPGEVLAVTGGAGLLASYVIPLAKEADLVVVADAKAEDAELVRGFGADHVVPRGDGFVGAVREHAPDGVAGLYDTALLHERVFGAIRDGGDMVVVRGWRPEQTERGITVHQVMVGEALTRTDWLEELRDLAADGRLRLRVAGEYPPEEAAEAHRRMDAGGLRGRVVIRF